VFSSIRFPDSRCKSSMAAAAEIPRLNAETAASLFISKLTFNPVPVTREIDASSIASLYAISGYITSVNGESIAMTVATSFVAANDAIAPAFFVIAPSRAGWDFCQSLFESEIKSPVCSIALMSISQLISLLLNPSIKTSLRSVTRGYCCSGSSEAWKL